MSSATARSRMSQETGIMPLPSWPVEQKQMLGDLSVSDTIRTYERATLLNAKTRGKKAVEVALLEIKSENDGIMRATLIVGAIGWAIGWLVDVAVLAALEGTLPTGTRVSIRAAAVAGAMALPFELYLHLDIVRQMRRHPVDEYLKCIVCLNADMFGFIIGFAGLLNIVVAEEGDRVEKEKKHIEENQRKEEENELDEWEPWNLGVVDKKKDSDQSGSRNNISGQSGSRGTEASGSRTIVSGKSGSFGSGDSGSRTFISELGKSGTFGSGSRRDSGESEYRVDASEVDIQIGPRTYWDEKLRVTRMLFEGRDMLGWSTTYRQEPDAQGVIGPLNGGQCFDEAGSKLPSDEFWWRANVCTWMPGDNAYTLEDEARTEQARKIRDEHQKIYEESEAYIKGLKRMQALLRLDMDDVVAEVARQRKMNKDQTAVCHSADPSGSAQQVDDTRESAFV
eukprot:gnl/TRDRNA2_/TRDRNA2_117079_c0_seq1.p1 gnl/TRDRNA2_/TRDRNA2_117079_c0~~gnl/TRDRNA2_/TRDRNA2_117079_c0_seq1.p1  ORF type:complete len:475 (+),score=56.67 gnl/TRDRNA2_/TRDRNA2_117079_c0_seq1:72-1427(+)